MDWKKTIVINGTLPDDLEVQYKSNKLTQAGTVTVTASFIENPNYNDLDDLTATLTITKKELIATYVAESIFYNETPALEVSLTGFVNGENEDVLTSKPFVVNTNTEVGEYKLKPQNGLSDNYYFVYVEDTLTIKKIVYSSESIHFDDQIYVYDGLEKTIEVSGIIPDGVSVKYTANKLTNVGFITVTASFEVDKYHDSIPELTARLTITKATYDMSGVSFSDTSYTYDGKEKELLINGILNTEIVPMYTNNKLTNVGSTIATVSFTGSSNYEDIDSMTATLTVAAASLTIGYVPETVVYGKTPSLEISYSGFIAGDSKDNLDTLATVYNDNTNVGTYTLTPEGATSSNYIINYIPGDLVIIKKVLTATYVDETVNISSYALLTVNVIGYIPNEGSTDLTTYPFVEIYNTDAGTYSLTPHGGVADNYSFNNIDGILVIENSYFSEWLVFTNNSDGTYNVASGTCTSENVVIPEYYNGKLVTTIPKDAFLNNTTMKTVSLPDSITTIEENAFKICSELETITITSSVTSIEKYTFFGDKKLKTVVLPDNLESIGYSAFASCEELENVNIPNTVSSIDSYAFRYCYKLESITIPNNIDVINEYTFSDCTSLHDVTLPDSLTEIKSYAFYSCSAIEEISFPDSLTTIRNTVFTNCSSIQTLNIPNSVTSIGTYAFQNCSSLVTISLSTSLEKINPSTFKDCTSLTSIDIPSSVTNIGISAFYNCNALTSINFNEGLISIDSLALKQCSSLTTVTMPSTLQSVGENVFKYCDSSLVIYIHQTDYTSSLQSSFSKYNVVVI